MAGMYKRILVPLDGSERAERVLPHAAEIARCSGATLVLLQVLTARSEVLQQSLEEAAPALDVADEKGKAELEQAGSYFDELEQRLTREGVPHVLLLAEGVAAKALAATVQEQRIDLVAMTTPSRSVLGRLLHGSTTAESLLSEIEVPVLLLRSEKS